MKKQLLILCLALIATINLFATQVDGIWYDFDDTKLTASVTYRGSSYSTYSNEYTGSVVIPASVSYNSKTYSVTTIGEDAFHYCSELTSVTIPNSVTTIGWDAFSGCSGLTSVVWNAINCSAGSSSSPFSSAASKIKSFTFGNEVETIPSYLCHGMSNLTSITIPNSVTTIGEYAFYGCSGLTSVTIGNSVTTIGYGAFSNCSGLTSVTIPNSVTTIGFQAFYNVNNIVYNGTATGSPWGAKCVTGYIDGYLVYSDATKTQLCGCSTTATGAITIPNSVTTIGDGAFRDCSGLTSVTIGNSVTTIGESAFTSCKSLTSVTIPNSVTTIEESAFTSCKSLTSVTIPNSVTTIGDYAFDGCSGLTKTNYTGIIADWCKIKFGNYSANPMCYSHNFFINDVEIKDLVIPEGVDTIGEYAFYGCSGLTSVTIGNSVTTIGYGAFSNCSGLTSVTIPNSVTTIGDGAFYGCSGLKSVTISSSVTTIGNDAFYGCSGLTSVTIPNSVTTIGDGAFYGCSGLKSPVYNANCFVYMPKSYKGAYIIPDGIQQIADYAFYNCTGLTSITIPNSVTTIGERAFSGCSGLTSVTIPNSVTWIGDYAFYGCSGLPIENGLRYADTYLVEAVNKTQSNYTIKEGTKWIGDDAFYKCSSLISVNIPNSVTTIGNYAFCKCTSLNSIVLPQSITALGNGAFEDCYYLTSIICYAVNPPICGDYCFSDVSKNISIYVPGRSIEAYKNAGLWGGFTDIRANPNIVTCNVENGTIVGAGKYDYLETCTLTVTPNCGYHFTQWNDGNTDNPRSFVVTQDTTFTAQIDTTKSGQCGDDLYWQLENDTLIITGSGAMYDYTEAQPAEWYLSNGKIAKLILPTGITHIGDSAFAGCEKIKQDLTLPNDLQTIGDYAFRNCKNITSISFGTDIETIGDYAFAGCIRIDNMTCPTARTPDVTEHTFDMVSRYAYLYVLQPYERVFKIDPYWGVFDIHTINAEEKPIEGDQVVVTPSTDNATFTWPVNPSADGYSLEITKDGVVFCTLKFNAQGQLTGIAFAPSRGGQAREMASATMTANGWQFTVTGLSQGSKYGYTLDVLNASQQSIKHYQGEFTTTGGISTDINGLTIDNTQCTVRKFIRNNQLQILHNGKMYNALGDRMR